MITSTKELIDAVRDLVGQTMDLGEAEVLEALLHEAHGWQMRLDEISGEEGE